MHISLQIIIATLSAMGVYYALKTVASLLFTSRQIAAAVMIDEEKQLRQLDRLLEDASSALFAARRRRIVVFIPTKLWEGCDERVKKLANEISEDFGAEFYVY